MSIVYMMVGIPASGKTTIAKKFSTNNQSGYVSRDEIRLKITHSSEVKMELEHNVLVAFCDAVLEKLKTHLIVFADATHCTPRSRFIFLRTLKEECSLYNYNFQDISVIPFIVETPFEICYNRNLMRSPLSKTPDEQMNNYYKEAQLHYPKKDTIGIETCFPMRIFYNSLTDEMTSVKFE